MKLPEGGNMVPPEGLIYPLGALLVFPYKANPAKFLPTMERRKKP
jgi:hypothetical protein